MDILYLLDQLEEVLGTGSKLPFTSRTLVDEQEVLDILDQIRMSIPEELKAARRLSQERDQVLADARAEAERMLREADEHAAGRISEHALVRTAEARASEIEERAMRQAEQVREEAEAYAYRVLERLREQINQVGQTVERGLRELDTQDSRQGVVDGV
ncbi:MAG TPA: ATPase [Chloroflexota bacterium]|nr:ATPase [Chloroflexota bacterium]